MEKYVTTEYQQKILNKRYAQIKENGEKETSVTEIFGRVSTAVSKLKSVLGYSKEQQEKIFYKMLIDKEFIPGGRILANVGGIGTNMAGNCFVLPITDSRKGIMRCQYETFEVNATGGGTGTCFSPLRPKGAEVKGVRGESSGPCSFMDGFDAYALTIKQGGSRRAARMTMLNVDHPDIVEFITTKQDLNKWTTTNISTGILDKFMVAVENNTTWDLEFGGKIYETIQANDLWNTICECAWETGEPGVVFVDTLNRKYPLSYKYRIDAVNVCGELPLPPYGMCLLGSIIVSSFVSSCGDFDWGGFKTAVKNSVIFLDGLIDTTTFPLPEIEERVKSTRPIGLGMTGLADMLFLLGIPYGDNTKCLDFLDKLGKVLYETAKKTSELLAKETGCFPDYDNEKADYPPRKNSTLIAYAPTGSISGFVGTSYGIEPHFAPSVIRNEELGRDVVSNATIDKWMQNNNVEELPNWARFVGGVDNKYKITVEDHLEVLAVLSKHVDSAISKTINLPKSATVEDISNIYKFMYTHGIKGGTVYRDGCRDDQPITMEITEKPVIVPADDWEDSDELEFINLIAQPRLIPDEVEACRYRLKYNPRKPSLYIHITDDNDGPLEIFFSTLDAQNQETLDGLALTMTSLFRRGIDCFHLLNKWGRYESANGGAWYGGKYVPSMLSGIAMVLQKHFKKMGYITITDCDTKLDKIIDNSKDGKIHGERCPECGMFTLIRGTGCPTCISCGYSSC